MKVRKTIEVPVDLDVSPIEVIEQLAADIHAVAVGHGFWDGDESPFIVPTKLALITDEVSEALSVHRDEPCDSSCHCGREDEDEEMCAFQAEEFGIELADIIIRTLDLAHHYHLPIGRYVTEKIEKNKSRPYMHNKRY